MDKIVYLLEYIPRNVLINADSDVVIALTPMAMYQLDRRGIRYRIPTDYIYPIAVEPVDFEVNVFNQILSETRQTEDYWRRLLDCFPDADIQYFGTEFIVLRRIIEGEKNEG